MKTLRRIRCGIVLGIAGLLGIVFTLDLILGIPFGQLEIMTDVLVIIAAGFIVWQGIETWFQL